MAGRGGLGCAGTGWTGPNRGSGKPLVKTRDPSRCSDFERHAQLSPLSFTPRFASTMPPPSSHTKGKKRAASPSRSSAASKKPKSDVAAAGPQASFTSALVSEEVAFPRGGGSGLTPLEYKEVLGEGRREADQAVAAEGAAAAAVRRCS
jgi:hypothetical protein